MALTYTPEGSLGSPLPTFTLPSVEGRTYAKSDFAGKPVVVFFICNHCPYVQAIEQRLLNLAHRYKDRAHFIGICSNDSADYPEDAPAELLKTWRNKNYGFPYLLDESQQVAKAFGAVCTPDIFLYDQRGSLRYRGRLDDSWRDPAQVRKEELRLALDQLLAAESVSSEQNPSMGCSIKWKKG